MAVLLPIGVPILPPEALAGYARAIGASSAEATSHSRLPMFTTGPMAVYS